MNDGIEQVRGVLNAPEDVDLPPELAGVNAEYDNPPPPFDGDDRTPEEIELDARVGKAADLPLNDYGNGQRFVLHFGSDLMWVPRVGWFDWRKTVWKKDQDMIGVRAKAQKLGPLIAKETIWIKPPPAKWALVDSKAQLDAEFAELSVKKDRTEDDEKRLMQLRADRGDIDRLLSAVQDRIGQRLRHAKNAGNSGPINNMINEGGISLARDLDDLDADPLMVNTLSGVLVFKVENHKGIKRATVELRPHDRGDLLTKMIPVVYDPKARCDGFRTFIDRIQPDPDMQGFLQRVFGLSMTALVEQMLCFFYGDGANGKSVLVDLIANILGDYAATAKIESLTGQNRRGGGDATPDLVPLIGARFVRSSEPDKGVQWQEGLIKELTGGEPILVRALQQDFVEVRPRFKLIVSGNHKPEIRGTDDGIWRRLKLVPFDVQIPEEERVPKQEMDARLFAEASGVLNWMVEGLLDYLEGGLQEPTQIRSATQAFREESDPYGAFLEDACIITGDAEDSLKSIDLVHGFNFWLGRKGEGEFKDRTVALALKDRSRRYRSKATGQKFTQLKSGGTMRYTGIRFNDLFRRDFQDAPKDQRGRPIHRAGSAGGYDDGAHE